MAYNLFSMTVQWAVLDMSLIVYALAVRLISRSHFTDSENVYIQNVIANVKTFTRADCALTYVTQQQPASIYWAFVNLRLKVCFTNLVSSEVSTFLYIILAIIVYKNE